MKHVESNKHELGDEYYVVQGVVVINNCLNDLICVGNLKPWFLIEARKYYLDLMSSVTLQVRSSPWSFKIVMLNGFKTNVQKEPCSCYDFPLCYRQLI